MPTEIRQQDGVTILTPNGRMIGSAVPEFRETIVAQIEASDAPRILINFEEVRTIDSSGLGSLMEANVIAKNKGGRIGAINVAKQISNLIVVSRITNLFEHFDSESDAISGLSD